jgi:hypothetical protein
MTFVFPLFLWALTAVSVPVIIHLFNFRRYKKVYFTNVRFLKDLQQESKSKSRLKELLVLLCRCLMLASVVLAFSQPVMKDHNDAQFKNGIKTVAIYIDNSFSMDNVSRQGPLLQIAKGQAKELIKSFGNADRFYLLTNDFEGRHQRFNTKENALELVEEVRSSPTPRRLSEVLKRQQDFLTSAGVTDRRSFIFSDAQRSTFDLDAVRTDTVTQTLIFPLKANRVNNLYIDTCWFESPLQQKGFIQKLHVRIVNNGASDIDIATAKLTLNKQQSAIASFSVEAGSSAETMFTFESKTEGFNFGTLKIEDYPVNFDDELFFAFDSRVNVKVSLINGSQQPQTNAFTSLFGSDSLFKLRTFTEQSIDYGTFASTDVLVLNGLTSISSGLAGELSKFTTKGGAVVFVPPVDADMSSYNISLSALKLPAFEALDTTRLKTDKIEYAGEFYSGVFERTEARLNLPLVNRHYRLNHQVRSDFETILSLQNGETFFGRLKNSNSFVYLFSAPLDDKSGNFNKHALFVPTFYRIAFSSLKPLPLFYHSGTNVVLSLKNDALRNETPPHIVKADGKFDFIPELRNSGSGIRLYTRGQVATPGFYELRSGPTVISPLAFNYSRAESALQCYSPEELNKIIDLKGLASFKVLGDVRIDTVKEAALNESGKKLWKFFLFLALIFLALETVVLRLFK